MITQVQKGGTTMIRLIPIFALFVLSQVEEEIDYKSVFGYPLKKKTLLPQGLLFS
jgi:hypothetical protein